MISAVSPRWRCAENSVTVNAISCRLRSCKDAEGSYFIVHAGIPLVLRRMKVVFYCRCGSFAQKRIENRKTVGFGHCVWIL